MEILVGGAVLVVAGIAVLIWMATTQPVRGDDDSNGAS